MALDIKLTAEKGSSQGIDFDAYIADYFSDFYFSGWPYILGGGGPFEGDQIVILDELEANPKDTKTIVLDGEDIFYEFSAHHVTGTLEQVRLATLGSSYQSDGSFKQDASGHITAISASVDISGFALTDDFHEIVADLMGGAHEGGLADASRILDAMKLEAHNVRGSTKADVYVGTKFADTIAGGGGTDTLDGGGGNDGIKGDAGHDDLKGSAGKDTLEGGAGNDTLDGGVGNDELTGGVGRDFLTGGAGRDTFIFEDWKESQQPVGKRDVYDDFSQAQKDRISLAAVDADTVTAGDQDFSFVGTDKFSKDAGELRYVHQGDNTLVQGDVNGDGKADFAFLLAGTLTLTLTGAEFLV